METVGHLYSHKVSYQVFSLSIVAIFLVAFTPLSFIAIAGALFSVYILNSLILSFGEGVPVNLVIILLACLQWIIGPILSYYTGINHPFYGMRVRENEYFNFVVPGVLMYHIGLSLPIMGLKDYPKRAIISLDTEINNKIKGAYYLVAIGFIATILRPFSPPSLFFILYLIANLKFIGCFYLYLSSRSSRILLWAVFITLLLEALATAMFHDLLLWSMFFLFIYCIKNKVSLFKKVVTVVISFMMLFVLQSIKYEFRGIAWQNTSMDSYTRLQLFTGMVIDRIWSPELLVNDQQANEINITRLNQGWIIARVMDYIPTHRPFADGETVQGAFSAALVPRFISQSKAVAGGREMMERFTGIILEPGTSMNVSLIGEGYGNYGKTGGIVFMFFIGIFFSIVTRAIITRSLDNPAILFWIPFLYLQVVKAETDLTTTLNHLVKALILMIIVFYFFKRYLKVEI